MNKLLKIGELADKFNISTRTLRYYEEEGLIDSVRLGDSRYRYYDSKTVKRLEQILILRELNLTISDIKNIFSSKDLNEVVNIFHYKLNDISIEIRKLKMIQEAIEKFLSHLNLKTYNNINSEVIKLLQKQAEMAGLPTVSNYSEKECLFMNDIKKLTNSDIRIIELKPMKVAWYRAESESPEQDAWETMLKWVEKNGIKDLPTTRFFGFDNPSPTQGKSVYGYEVWVTIPDDFKGSEEVQIKSFEGGLYAVTNTSYKDFDIQQKWQMLIKWVEKSEFDFDSRQCLEETISIGQFERGNIQLDLYLPVKE
jgi:DNA-binding transcriptional MerR regulator/DNA gyrase inhibitor GyrI